MDAQKKKINVKKYLWIMAVELAIFLVMLVAFLIYINSGDAKLADARRKSREDGGNAVIENEDSESGEKDLGGEFDEPDYVIDSSPGSNISFNPHAVDSTNPDNLIKSSEIEVDGIRLEDSYDSAEYFGDISFGTGEEYTDVEGVVTFRGNNFRDNPTFGNAYISEGYMAEMWNVTTGALSFEDATWSGSGWTGQPLMRCWSREAKSHMNMYDWTREKDGLVEVIYACMDGYIYFLDMETGEKTRDRMELGFVFKGAGALDPRGYPIMYLGAGYDSSLGHARVFIINLLDCSVMYTFGNDDPFALRGDLSYFDSSALVDPETDTLIYPGENGVLYFIHLGTVYDEESGNLSISPDRTVKWRYTGIRNTHDKYWPGMETSAALYEQYLYIADNGGNLLCLDISTLEIVWAQDILDDSNSTPVLSIEDGRLYLYVSTSFHLGWRSSTTANVPVWKLDAETGEVIWKTEYECSSAEGVSGGVQSTIAVGRGNMSDYVYVTVAMTHGQWGGDIAALNKSNGSKAWEKQMSYTWSSPVCVYDSSGSGVVIYGASDGNLYMADGLTGEEKSRIKISDGNIEASPAVYESTLVVGTRSGKICGVALR